MLVLLDYYGINKNKNLMKAQFGQSFKNLIVGCTTSIIEISGKIFLIIDVTVVAL